MKKINLISIILSISFSQDSQVINGYEYSKPNKITFISSFHKDIYKYGKYSLRMEKLNEWLSIIGLTGLFMYYDEQLIYESQKLGHKLKISNKDETTEFFSILGQPIRLPTDLGSSLYFIGDGILHLGISGSFYTYGSFTNNYKAMQTGSQILQAMASAGLLTQIIKHITGRVSPFRNYTYQKVLDDGYTIYRPKDKWTPFPNQIEYHKHVSYYDAFPSGHMAVAMATVTVIAENYSDIWWVKPVGYSAMSLLGFQMMNNGVHWISDYPLSIAMGYYLGKIAVDNGRIPIKKNYNLSSISIKPMFDSNFRPTILIKYQF